MSWQAGRDLQRVCIIQLPEHGIGQVHAVQLPEGVTVAVVIEIFVGGLEHPPVVGLLALQLESSDARDAPRRTSIGAVTGNRPREGCRVIRRIALEGSNARTLLGTAPRDFERHEPVEGSWVGEHTDRTNPPRVRRIGVPRAVDAVGARLHKSRRDIF